MNTENLRLGDGGEKGELAARNAVSRDLHKSQATRAKGRQKESSGKKRKRTKGEKDGRRQTKSLGEEAPH